MRTVDEIALKYEAIARIDPVHRLGLSLAQLALAVDRANRAAAGGVPAAASKSAPPPATAQRADNVAAAREGFSDL